ncbi:MAG: type I restriction endonuclease subunit R [Bacteroidaceae bacterium]|nr:type I restriction endonuclease subunit R [Bacteroidaceae bacterium]
MTENYNIVVEQEESTVVAKYERQQENVLVYQSEAQLERSFIKQLKAQGYDYPTIKDEKALIENLRHQLELLNNYTFTDTEWKRLFDGQIAGESMTIEDKTVIIQRENILNLQRDNGETKNIKLLDKKNIHNNRLQVINQYVPEGGTASNRYDVTVLVNGLPLVHIELKRRGVSIKEAFNQINRYQRETFWAGRALFDYVQIFVISNGTQTKYYSNTTRFAHEKEMDKQPQKKIKRESNSFEFTSYWADAKNRILPDLTDFTTTFFAKHTLLNILTKYCVFTVDKNLMVMRPYQIAATERILMRIQQASYNKWQGTIKAGGYIWHTTGSGKTLTSFKTAQLASQMECVDKVLFVVDRKDLDYQTMKEYDNFEKDCANSNTNIRKLYEQLNDDSVKIIITTIQKLSTLLKKKDVEVKALNQNVVMIFDECHRSQFGDMHVLITRKFKKDFLFGFTGTPIFSVNAGAGKNPNLRTTAQAFGGEPDDKGNPTKALHTYTIINAINDKNVLKFKVDYISTMKMKEGVGDEKVWGIDTDEVLHDPRRIANNVKYILEHFDQKTKQANSYGFSKITNVAQVVKRADEKKLKVKQQGFNSIFAVDSVPTAIRYYEEFKKQQEGLAPDKRLRVATIFTYAANEAEDDTGTLEDENPEATDQLDVVSKDALERAIRDYNETFGTSYDTSSEKFQNYYKDVSLRMKNKEVDILIVVGMFLTGFDSKTINTLWVDKNLKLHGLLQAYSRTNRILNAVKDCGNIVCFRNLEKATNDSFALFGDENANGIILVRPFRDYYYGYTDDKGNRIPGYKELIDALLAKFPVGGLADITSEEEKLDFIRQFGAILKLQNLLSSFDEFTAEKAVVTEGEMQNYKSWYLDLRDEFKPEKQEAEKVNEDIEFEMDLIKQVQINIDYILRLVNKFHESNCMDKEIIVKIKQAISSSPDMRDKRELIEKFIDRMTPESSNVYDDWEQFVAKERKEELDKIIDEENLNPEETYKFMEDAFQDGEVSSTGTAITKILPKMKLFGGGGNKRAVKKQTVLDKLRDFFGRFYDISDGQFQPDVPLDAIIHDVPQNYPHIMKKYQEAEEGDGMLMAAERKE